MEGGNALLLQAATYFAAAVIAVMAAHRLGFGSVAGYLDATQGAPLGVPPLVGRTFTDDSSLEASPCRVCASPTATSDSALVAVLSYRYWQTHYAGASNVIGRTLQVDDQPYTIIGIMPERFRFSNVAFYIPLPSGNDRRSTLTLLRLRPGVSTAAATAELQALVQQQQFDPTKSRGGR